MHGEVRPTYDPRSTLYNTDGQAYSDTGVPVFMFLSNCGKLLLETSSLMRCPT